MSFMQLVSGPNPPLATAVARYITLENTYVPLSTLFLFSTKIVVPSLLGFGLFMDLVGHRVPTWLLDERELLFVYLLTLYYISRSFSLRNLTLPMLPLLSWWLANYTYSLAVMYFYIWTQSPPAQRFLQRQRAYRICRDAGSGVGMQAVYFLVLYLLLIPVMVEYHDAVVRHVFRPAMRVLWTVTPYLNVLLALPELRWAKLEYLLVLAMVAAAALILPDVSVRWVDGVVFGSRYLFACAWYRYQVVAPWVSVGWVVSRLPGNRDAIRLVARLLGESWRRSEGGGGGGDIIGSYTTDSDPSGSYTTGSDKTSDDSASGDDTSGGDTSGGDTSGGDKSEDDKSGDDKSGDDISGGDTSGGDTSGGDTSGGDKSGDDKSGDDTSGDDKSEEDAGEEDISGDDISEEDTSGDDISEEDISEEDTSGDDTGGEDASGDGTDGADTSGRGDRDPMSRPKTLPEDEVRVEVSVPKIQPRLKTPPKDEERLKTSPPESVTPPVKSWTRIEIPSPMINLRPQVPSLPEEIPKAKIRPKTPPRDELKFPIKIQIPFPRIEIRAKSPSSGVNTPPKVHMPIRAPSPTIRILPGPPPHPEGVKPAARTPPESPRKNEVRTPPRVQMPISATPSAIGLRPEMPSPPEEVKTPSRTGVRIQIPSPRIEMRGQVPSKISEPQLEGIKSKNLFAATAGPDKLGASRLYPDILGDLYPNLSRYMKSIAPEPEVEDYRLGAERTGTEKYKPPTVQEEPEETPRPAEESNDMLVEVPTEDRIIIDSTVDDVPLLPAVHTPSMMDLMIRNLLRGSPRENEAPSPPRMEPVEDNNFGGLGDDDEQPSFEDDVVLDTPGIESVRSESVGGVLPTPATPATNRRLGLFMEAVIVASPKDGVARNELKEGEPEEEEEGEEEEDEEDEEEKKKKKLKKWRSPRKDDDDDDWVPDGSTDSDGSDGEAPDVVEENEGGEAVDEVDPPDEADEDDDVPEGWGNDEWEKDNLDFIPGQPSPPRPENSPVKPKWWSPGSGGKPGKYYLRTRPDKKQEALKWAIGFFLGRWLVGWNSQKYILKVKDVDETQIMTDYLRNTDADTKKIMAAYYASNATPVGNAVKLPEYQVSALRRYLFDEPKGSGLKGSRIHSPVAMRHSSKVSSTPQIDPRSSDSFMRWQMETERIKFAIETERKAQRQRNKLFWLLLLVLVVIWGLWNASDQFVEQISKSHQETINRWKADMTKRSTRAWNGVSKGAEEKPLLGWDDSWGETPVTW